MAKSINNFFEEVNNVHEDELLFADDIFELLPELFRQITDKFGTKQEKDAALITSMACIGGLCCNYESQYDNRIIESNMYVFLLSKFGEGKGALSFVRKLAEPTDNEKEKQYKEKYLAWSKNENKGYEPKRTILIIPANTTKIQLLKLIADNGGRATIFETEADTLSNAMNSKFGEFGDILRAGLQGEPSSFARSTDNVVVKIPRTTITLLVSGTEGQVKRLITDFGDGLASRIDFYRQSMNYDFKPVLTAIDSGYEQWFYDKGVVLYGLHQQLVRKKKKLKFTWTDQQKLIFENYWMGVKHDKYSEYDGKYNGAINRQALKCAKIAMVLSIIRVYTEQLASLPDIITCTNEDFYIALSMAETLLNNNIYVSEKLLHNKTEKSGYVMRQKEKMNLEQRIIDMWNRGEKNAAKIAKAINTYPNYVHRCLSRNGIK